MPWYSPPTRQEVTLILFCLTTFILFYNVESSFQYLGTDPTNSEVLVGRLGLNKANHKLSTSGGDALEKEVFGEWEGHERRAASNGGGIRRRDVDEDKSAAFWIEKETVTASQKPEIFGNIAVDDGFFHWGAQVPQVTVVKHVPGFTILDNVIVAGGTIFLVSDHASSLPPLGSIASSAVAPTDPPREEDWQVLSGDEARVKLGSYGGLIHGVSWLSTDATPSNHTLFSLWRTYSSLDPSITSDGQTSLPPPRRIFFPNIPTFTGIRPDLNKPIVLRHRSPSGFHPFLPKAAFPTLGLMYKEDWEDFALMAVPFVLKRVVVADRGAATRSRSDVPPISFPCTGSEMGASQYWWEPVRRSLAAFLGVDQALEKTWRGKERPTITYISAQDADLGPALRNVDHDALVSALEKMGRDYSYTVNIVSSQGSWTERMTAIAKSTIVLGVYGDSLTDCLYMKPSSHSMVMEIFPPDVFVGDGEIAVRSLGTRYIAWRNNQQFSGESLPPVALPGSVPARDISVDPAAIVQAIRKEVDRAA
ncbi:hypothetical protein BV22DRAFT_1100231 [Leucogyrophana mollusca]|uniref:Uncharacterized protein n=1 Tax=Leucogyrophana mollusca TaxID=85980 RepID=A0ACB8AYQ4_9AGAM|nr:hypothetical protein BV22DRAFT_1100231 [Leucogyrophana mollusca]